MINEPFFIHLARKLLTSIPLNPQSYCGCVVTVPISINHCFLQLTSIPICRYIREAICYGKESISRHESRGESCATPPDPMNLACILVPETLS